MKLTKDEVTYLWKKIENKKKKKAIETENDLYQLLNSDINDFSDDDFEKIIKSLEFTFRKRLIGDKPDLKNDLFLSIKLKKKEN